MCERPTVYIPPCLTGIIRQLVRRNAHHLAILIMQLFDFEVRHPLQVPVDVIETRGAGQEGSWVGAQRVQVEIVEQFPNCAAKDELQACQ